MEKKAKQILLVMIVLLAVINVDVKSQKKDVDYGSDSIACLNNLSTMNEYMKIDLISYAVDSWRKVFNMCPASSKNIYIYGVKIVKYLIDKEQNEQRVNELVDTLMLLYDRRIKYFDEEGYVLGRKAIDLLRYRKQDLVQAYGYLKKSIELEGNKSDEAILVTYMQLSNILFKNQRIDNQDVVNNYMNASQILEANPASNKEGTLPQKALATIQDIFADSGAAGCETLVSIFEPKFKENPDDKDQLKKILAMLERSGCQESQLFTDASVQLFKIEPSASSAYYLAKVFLKKQDYEKAADYYKQAINLESDNTKKAAYYFELAAVQSRQDLKEQARSNALKAAELRPNWGDPYILIGNLYATSAPTCGSNDFAKNAVYWVAVDKYIKAKQVDPDIADKANDMIKKYSEYFPNKENAFFYGVNEGDSYTVGCWINETTTARF